MHRLTNLTRVAVAGAVIALGACEGKRDILLPSLAGGNDMFKSYVALGNSITAGFQSNGITDSTQRQSYARLLAAQMGTQYHYPAIFGRGCPPPIANGVTGALLGNASATTCDLRAPASVTDVLNNVAVPGARVLDPISPSTIASNTLTTLVLGGKTQVARALDARPTFVSIWIGNNDVLQPGLSGLYIPIVSTQAQFQTSYDAMLKQLLDNAPGLRGVLIAVAQVSGLPTMVSGALIFSSPAARGAINAAAGQTVVIDASCNGSASLVNIVSMIQAIRAGSHPAVIACSAGVYPAPVGDIYVLDAAEQATLSGAIDAYNGYLKSKAAAVGFAYYDPNPLFAASRASGAIPPFPNFQSTTATYGSLVSLDGVHPSAAAHRLIVHELIVEINKKYGTSLPAVP
jgi:lysophospholipase L1-like esterase